jgi:Tfp pilus assembly protein PilF/MinD-like ATPase involved in chromosome partitioning or flagellar assembly
MTDDITQAPAAFVTFYSFKGGVGRSMALINVAGILAGRGFRVLALDMDLEAPGISYLMQGEGEQTVESRPGFVDLLADACSRGTEADLFALEPGDVVEKYSYPYSIPEAIRQSDEGVLRIMPAGRLTGDYQARLDGLTLGQLYREGVGQPIMTAFKRVLQDAKQFDFVFVDSRTGFSDEAGVCTRDLADCLMIVMGLNRQNVEGTSAFLRSLREAGVSKTIRVALSPVPNGDDELVEQRGKDAEAALSVAYGEPVKLSLQIPYHPRLALTEEPHVFRRSQGYLYDAYARIEMAVLTMLGHSPRAFVRTIESAVKDKRLDVVVRHLERLRKLNQGAVVLESLVVGPLADLLLQKDAGELRRCLADSLPADSWAVPRVAAQLSMKSMSDAELFFQRALEGDSKDAITLGNYANFRWQVRGDQDRADALYHQALAIAPAHANILAKYAGFSWQAEGDEDGADALYNRARDAEPENARVLVAYARFLWTVRRDHDGAEALYKQARDLGPDDADALVANADFLAQARHDYAGAGALYKQAREIAPNDYSVLQSSATFFETVRGEFDIAEVLFQLARATAPEDSDVLESYAGFLWRVRNDDDGAERFYQQARAAAPRDFSVLLNYADFLATAREDGVGAARLYERAREIAPKNFAVVLHHADFLNNYLEDRDGAEALYKQAREIARQNPAVLASYANFLTAYRDDHDGAEAIYRQAREIAPKDADVLGGYAAFLTTVREDHDGAEVLFKQAQQADSKNFGVLGAYAHFLASIRKDHDGAEVLYKAAIAAVPREPNFLGNYAKLLFALGRTDEATRLVAQAWEKKPRVKALLCELHFYAYAHASHLWPDSLKNLKDLLQAGATSKGWPLQENVSAAKRQGHPEPEFLAALARVVSGEAPIETLDSFPVWETAHF